MRHSLSPLDYQTFFSILELVLSVNTLPACCRLPIYRHRKFRVSETNFNEFNFVIQ